MLKGSIMQAHQASEAEQMVELTEPLDVASISHGDMHSTTLVHRKVLHETDGNISPDPDALAAKVLELTSDFAVTPIQARTSTIQ